VAASRSRTEPNGSCLRPVLPAATATAPPKPKFTAQQVVQRLRELKHLYSAGYLTDEFYLDKVAECQVPQ